MAIFNSTQYSNLTNATDILNIANNFTSGFLGMGLWLMITFGTFFVLSNYSSKDSVLAASFVSLITALFLAYLEMLDGLFIWISAILFVTALIISIISGHSGGV